MAKKTSPATRALGVRRLTSCSDTEDFPAPGGPVTTTNSPTAALSLIGVVSQTHFVRLGPASQRAPAHLSQPADVPIHVAPPHAARSHAARLPVARPPAGEPQCVPRDAASAPAAPPPRPRPCARPRAALPPRPERVRPLAEPPRRVRRRRVRPRAALPRCWPAQ